MNKEKLVLAYSGGLDTSVLVHWLAQQGYEVIALCLDLGQKVEDLNAILEKGKKAGAAKVLIENVEEEFVQNYVFPSIHWNALYEGTYLLGTSLARPLISKKQIEVAGREGAVAVAHGATGKGNDQVRFELSYYALNPNIRVVAPWKIPEFYKKYPGRTELLAYADKYGIPVKASKNNHGVQMKILCTSVLNLVCWRIPGKLHYRKCLNCHSRRKMLQLSLRRF